MGMQGRSQMGMATMQYPQQQQVAPYGQQVLGGYSQQGQQQQQQGTPPYFSPPQPTPQGPNQSAYLQPRPPLPPQEAQQENFTTRGPAPGNSGKATNEDGVSQDRPCSLPDLSGSIDDLPTGTETGLGSAGGAGGSSSSNSTNSSQVEAGSTCSLTQIIKRVFFVFFLNTSCLSPLLFQDLSGSIDDLPTGTETGLGSAGGAGGSSSSNSTNSSQVEAGAAGNQGQSPFSPHLPNQRSGPSPSPGGSPAGSTLSQQSRSGSGPISPVSGPPTNTAASAPGSTAPPQNAGNGADGARPPVTRSPMAQDRGFMSNVQRNQTSSQFAPPQSGPAMSPHPSPGAPLYPGMAPYSQTGHSSSYGPQGSQYGHQGNYPRPTNYSSSSYSGPGMANSLGMNASSPMHGQGPGQPLPVGRNHGPSGQNRAYPTMAPSSPSIPQPAGPGMGPPSLGSSNRKVQESAAGAGTAGGGITTAAGTAGGGITGPVNSTHNR
ncbi:AT-rich interactive domain-containing protein 1B-like [Cynoglossus semilaevis]|uniref:AT-rich interactive domain-containing protein 1B-like n=1 Tax=Cynoglossus semilaevis TaxID=244447 RepID=UPI000D62E078|nr:AT-rich interactive domain-containing protein 1B-like [Cynoglossus semilaevis]